jgi:membrane associated rhomboid family serine protease
LALSPQGKNLITAVLGGLVVGTALASVSLDGYPLTIYLLQENGQVTMGWVWQLVTSIVVAPPNFTGLADVAFNAIAVAWLDGFFFLAYSRRQYYAVFLLTAIAGNVFSLASGPNAASFGASGGIFGLLSGVISFDIATNGRVNVTLVLWFVAIFIMSSFLFPGVDWLAHLGGAAVGLALGYGIGLRRKGGSEEI